MLGMWPGWVQREVKVSALRCARPTTSTAGGDTIEQKRKHTVLPRRIVVEVEESRGHRQRRRRSSEAESVADSPVACRCSPALDFMPVTTRSSPSA